MDGARALVGGWRDLVYGGRDAGRDLVYGVVVDGEDLEGARVYLRVELRATAPSRDGRQPGARADMPL